MTDSAPPPPPPPTVSRAMEVYLVYHGRVEHRTGEEPPRIGRIDSLPPQTVDRLIGFGLAALVKRHGVAYVVPTTLALGRTARLRWSEALSHFERAREIIARCRAGDWIVVDDHVEVVLSRVRPLVSTDPTAFREVVERLDWTVSPSAPIHPEPTP